MDNLLTLFNKGQYDLIIDLTVESKDPSELLLRASSYLALNKPEEALEVLNNNRDELYKFNPVSTIKGTMGAYYAIGDFSGAFKAKEAFNEYPYVSQEVEEVLRGLPNEISHEEAIYRNLNKAPRKKEEKKASHDNDIEHSDKLNEIMTKVTEGEDIANFEGDLLKILTSSDEALRTLAFMLLIRIKYPNVVEYKKNDKIYRLVPKDVVSPFESEDFIALVKALQEDAPSKSFETTAVGYLTTYMMALFPEKVFVKGDLRLLEAAILELTKQNLKENVDFSGLLVHYGITEAALSIKVLEIKQILSRLLTS